MIYTYIFNSGYPEVYYRYEADGVSYCFADVYTREDAYKFGGAIIHSVLWMSDPLEDGVKEYFESLRKNIPGMIY